MGLPVLEPSFMPSVALEFPESSVAPSVPFTGRQLQREARALRRAATTSLALATETNLGPPKVTGHMDSGRQLRREARALHQAVARSVAIGASREASMITTPNHAMTSLDGSSNTPVFDEGWLIDGAMDACGIDQPPEEFAFAPPCNPMPNNGSPHLDVFDKNWL